MVIWNNIFFYSSDFHTQARTHEILCIYGILFGSNVVGGQRKFLASTDSVVHAIDSGDQEQRKRGTVRHSCLVFFFHFCPLSPLRIVFE